MLGVSVDAQIFAMSDFASIGAQFRQAREARELTLEEVAKETRIRLKFLQAIEYGNFQVIDTSIQLRGFLRKYARLVGLDEHVVLAQYEQALHDSPRKRQKRRQQAASPPPPTPTPRTQVANAPPPNPALYTENRRSSSPFRLLLAIVAAILLSGSIIGGLVIALNDLTSTTETPGPGNELIQIDRTSTPMPSPTGNGPATTVPTPVIGANENVFIVLRAEQRLWVRVVTDGVVAFEGLLRPSDGGNYTANESITVYTSNAAGLNLTVNNQPFVLGTTREAAERTFTPGMGVSTATPDPNAVNTPTLLIPTNTRIARVSITATTTDTPTSPAEATLFFSGEVTTTPIPTIGYSTNTFTPSPTLPPPTVAPTTTPTPLLPPRDTRTPTLIK